MGFTSPRWQAEKREEEEREKAARGYEKFIEGMARQFESPNERKPGREDIAGKSEGLETKEEQKEQGVKEPTEKETPEPKAPKFKNLWERVKGKTGEDEKQKELEAIIKRLEGLK